MFRDAASQSREETKETENATVVNFQNAMFRNVIVSVNGQGVTLSQLKKIVCAHANSNEQMKFRHLNFATLVLSSDR